MDLELTFNAVYDFVRKAYLNVANTTGDFLAPILISVITLLWLAVKQSSFPNASPAKYPSFWSESLTLHKTAS